MASVDKAYPKKGAKRFRGCGCEEHWQVRWRDPNGKPGKATFCRKLDARRHGATMEADKARGTYLDDRDATTVLEYAQGWVASRRSSVRPGTRRLGR